MSILPCARTNQKARILMVCEHFVKFYFNASLLWLKLVVSPDTAELTSNLVSSSLQHGATTQVIKLPFPVHHQPHAWKQAPSTSGAAAQQQIGTLTQSDAFVNDLPSNLMSLSIKHDSTNPPPVHELWFQLALPCCSCAYLFAGSPTTNKHNAKSN